MNRAAAAARATEPDIPVLSIRDLHVSYFARGQEIRAVRGVNITVRAGETLALVGESGSGKSSVAFSAMRGLDAAGRIMKGSIHFGATDLLALNAQELRAIQGSRIAMVYQDPQTALNPGFRVGDQIAEVLKEHTDGTPSATRERVLQLLEEVKLPDPANVALRYPHELSGGQQQRVLIAMAFACNPQLLIMDEPTTGLDVTTEAHILDLVANLQRSHGSAILYITHNLGVVARFCQRVAVMYAGEILEEGPVSRVFSKPAHPYTRSLLSCIPRLDLSKHDRPLSAIEGRLPNLANLPQGCIFAARCEFRREICEQSAIEAENVGKGTEDFVRCVRWRDIPKFKFDRHIRKRKPGGKSKQAAGLLDIEDLRCYYQLRRSFRDFITGQKLRQVHAVDDIELEVGHGQTLAIVGESGCGKTTLGRTVVGLQPPTSGEQIFEGDELEGTARARSADLRRRIQIVFQNPDATLNPQKSVGETIRRPLQLFELVPPEKQADRVTELLRSVNLPASYAQRYPHELSGGEKQRVAVARAFAAEPELIVCDEPLSALDVSVQAAILNLLVELQKTSKTAYMFISHDLSVVRYLSDQVAVMYMGRLCEIGTPEDVFVPPYHPYTEALLSAISLPDPLISQETIRLEGSVPSPVNPVPGCRFASRCPRKIGAVCETEDPPLHAFGKNHRLYCHIPREELEKMKPVITYAGKKRAVV
ncbi:MAG: ABC transporter ATP-binding protein [Hyphomicrobiaceae bacterium]|nr:ABC transporter ATP-binding protein [Hyphomicrobiaceae bacterium]